MPQTLLDDLGMNPGPQQERGVGVAQLVDREDGGARLGGEVPAGP